MDNNTLESLHRLRLNNIKEMIETDHLPSIKMALANWSHWTYDYETFVRDYKYIIGGDDFPLRHEIKHTFDVTYFYSRASDLFKGMKHDYYLGLWVFFELINILDLPPSSNGLKFNFRPLYEIPENIPNISVTHLEFQDAKLTSLPYGLTKIKSLVDLNLDHNKLTRFPYLDMKGLRRLSLRNNEITEVEDFGGSPNLTYLGLGSNPLTNISNTITDLPLKSLFLPHTEIADISFIGGLPQLKTFLASNSLIHEIPISIVNCSNLEYLNLRATQISQVPAFLSKLTSLNKLDVSNTKVLKQLLPKKLKNRKRLRIFCD